MEINIKESERSLLIGVTNAHVRVSLHKTADGCSIVVLYEGWIWMDIGQWTSWWADFLSFETFIPRKVAE